MAHNINITALSCVEKRSAALSCVMRERGGRHSTAPSGESEEVSAHVYIMNLISDRM